MLLEPEDPLFWPDRPPGEAWYVHRLATAAHARGTGVALALMAWGYDQAARSGRPWYRLDCAPRPKLEALYESAGFAYVDEISVLDGAKVSSRYQRPLFVIDKAIAAEADDAFAVIDAASRKLAEAGEPLWVQEQYDHARIARWIAAGELYIARDDGEPAGTMRLMAEDREFWPKAFEGEALYVHKLAVAPGAAGKGVSRALIEKAAGEAARQGRAYLRLDCAPRAKLCAIYERAGFARVGEGRVGDWDVVLYERRIA